MIHLSNQMLLLRRAVEMNSPQAIDLLQMVKNLIQSHQLIPLSKFSYFNKFRVFPAIKIE